MLTFLKQSALVWFRFFVISNMGLDLDSSYLIRGLYLVFFLFFFSLQVRLVLVLG